MRPYQDDIAILASKSRTLRTKEMMEVDNSTEKEFKEGWKRRGT
jgi:hypothetical protein